MDQRIVLDCRKIHHAYGDNHVLHDVNLKIVRGEIVGLVGPSGCGKSTLLKAILGTLIPSSGQVVVLSRQKGETERHEHVVNGPGRDRGIVYQRYSLFPNQTALQNVAFGLMLDQTSPGFRGFRPLAWRELRGQHLAAARKLLEEVGLGQALDLYPHELSGGMRQRVAIAQALILRPAILLLDEPFGALDEATREELQRMLLTLYGENQAAIGRGEDPPYTILMVTHELHEALYVSDRVVGLSQYWNWKGAGHAAFPGATVVYDQPAPVFEPAAERDFGRLRIQKDQILESTFDPEVLQSREAFSRFWAEVAAGRGQGILQGLAAGTD